LLPPGAKGCAAAIIITAGLGHGPGSLAAASEQAALVSGLRLVGPNCLGVMAPRNGLNASFAASTPRPGDLALISQSGAIAAGLIEWAAHRNVGFAAVSLGDQSPTRKRQKSSGLIQIKPFAVRRDHIGA
jgi:acetyltransferase